MSPRARAYSPPPPYRRASWRDGKDGKTAATATATFVNAKCTCGYDTKGDGRTVAARGKGKEKAVVIVRECSDESLSDDLATVNEADWYYFDESFSSEAVFVSSSSSASSAIVQQVADDDVPALSPTRPPLFENDSDDDGDMPLTPSPFQFDLLERRPAFCAPPSTSALSVSPTSGARRKSLASIVVTDLHPLAVDVHEPPVAIWEPTTRVPSSKAHVAIEEQQKKQPRRASESLLTKSIRRLSRLPNLSLIRPSHSSLAVTLRSLTDSFGIDGSTYDAAPWSERSPTSSLFDLDRIGTSSSSLLRDDFEAATADVQLQTFSAPLVVVPPVEQPVRPSESTDASVKAGVPATAKRESSSNKAATPSSKRYISNPAHLLMLSLEITMMERGKIVAPLKPRSIVLRDANVEPRCGASSASLSNGSPLKYQVPIEG